MCCLHAVFLSTAAEGTGLDPFQSPGRFLFDIRLCGGLKPKPGRTSVPLSGASVCYAVLIARVLLSAQILQAGLLNIFVMLCKVIYCHFSTIVLYLSYMPKESDAHEGCPVGA